MYIEEKSDFFCFNLHLEAYGLHYLLNRFLIFNKNFLVRCIVFIEENLIILICPLCFKIRLNDCL